MTVKTVLKLGLNDDKEKKKAMKAVSGLPVEGVDSISVDMKDKKLTVVGEFDPVTIASELRKLCHTEIVSVGPAKEPEKKKDDKAKKEPKNMKAVLNVWVHDDKKKTEAMQTVTGLPGVDSISMDKKDKKMTVMGDIDPVTIVIKLRKLCHTEIVYVGPATEPKKKKDDEAKKEPEKKDKAKKEPEKKDEAKKGEQRKVGGDKQKCKYEKHDVAKPVGASKTH